MIIDILKKLGFDPISRQDELVKIWKEFYQGEVEDFHNYTEYLGAEFGSANRHRKSMNMAKVISELWADNLINPETQIQFEDEDVAKWFEEYDRENGVYESLNDLMELTFAFGTGATIQSKDANGKSINQYIGYDAIYPLNVAFGKITACAFATQIGDDEDKIYYIQVHKQDGEKWSITNLIYNEQGQEIEDKDIEQTFESDVKLYQLYQPAIMNNKNIGNKLGISIYANAIEEIKSVDMAFDSIDRELRNSRSRVYLRMGAMHLHEGKKIPIFDKDQDEFYILPEDDLDEQGQPITLSPSSFSLEPLIDNLEKQLNLLGTKCGLGDNAFYAKDGTIYTNTATVVSSNSKFYKTRQKHATRIEKSLVEMVKGLYWIEHGSQLESKVWVEFDDSIIHDKDEEYNRARNEYASGLISAVEYFMITRNMTQEEALKFWERQVEEIGAREEEPEDEGLQF